MSTIKTRYINEGATFIVESDEHSMSIPVTPENELVCIELNFCITELNRRVDFDKLQGLDYHSAQCSIVDILNRIEPALTVKQYAELMLWRTSFRSVDGELKFGMTSCGPAQRFTEEEAELICAQVRKRAYLPDGYRPLRLHSDDKIIQPDLLFRDPETGEELRPFGSPELTSDGKGMRLRVCNRDGDRKYIHTIYTEEF